jgi:gamma-glutamyltranspeptidase/glutathione hydrolase
MGPPSSGGTHVIELLNIFEGQDVGRLGLNTYESIRLMSEAMKRVFSEREKYMGDPDFVKVPIEDLLSKEHARTLGREMSTGKVIEKWVPDYLLAYTSDQTTHISIVDTEGNLVALTQTINSFFGSGVVVPGTGILLNNEMNDFIPKEGSPNSIKPRKRPVSNMSPTLVLKDGKPYMTIGMPGATRIITVLPQILMNIIDHKMTIQKAIDAPRIHCEADKEIFIESRIPKEVQDDLTRKGYKLVVKKDFDLYFGGTQGVIIDPKTGKPYGGADPRREGSVMGY